MAPEQVEAKEADARTDIFAFGATLYEMTTGKKAFSGTSQASLITAIMSSEPAPISTLQPMSPPALDRVVKKCLAKSGSVAAAPLFSRDGRFIYYSSLGPKRFQIRRRPVRGSGPEETVFEANAYEAAQDETPDGKTLIVQNTKRSYDIWALPLEGDRKLIPLLTTEFSERQPRLSPDGRWLAYVSDESGRFEVYVRRFPVTEEKWQVSTRGGIWPYWKGDGKEIYYIGLDAILMAAPVSAGQTFSVGPPESLFQTRLRVWTVARQYAASRDGQRFLMIYPTQDPAASPMNVLLNWQAPAGRK